MANQIVAGNSSNGGTAISTDTSGTLNIVTGSGSGSNAITIDASQNVAMTASQTVAGNLTVTGTLNANALTNTTGSFSGDLSFNSGYGSAAVAYGCRAWVNFNGTGTVAIRASGNVSSITDNATGNYTINFTTAMPDINYCVCSNGSPAYGVADFTSVGLFSTAAAAEVAPTVSAARIVTRATSVSDLKYITVSVFR
jgi:hypothetical protein